MIKKVFVPLMIVLMLTPLAFSQSRETGAIT